MTEQNKNTKQSNSTKPLVSGRSEQLVDFVRWLNEKSYWVRIPDKVVEEYEQYLLYRQKKSTNFH